MTEYNIVMGNNSRYTDEHAAAGLDCNFPAIETWENQFPGYEILIDDPEFTSVCPKTGLPCVNVSQQQAHKQLRFAIRVRSEGHMMRT